MSVFGQNCVFLNNGWFPVNPVKTDSNKETVVDATETGFLPGLEWSEAYKYPLVMVEHGYNGLLCCFRCEDNCHYQHQNLMIGYSDLSNLLQRSPPSPPRQLTNSVQGWKQEVIMRSQQ